MQAAHLHEQAFQPAADCRGHGGGRRLRRGAKPADFRIKPGKIKRITIGKTCLCLAQAFPHGLDGGKNRHAMCACCGA